jgi:hypothetical protein
MAPYAATTSVSVKQSRADIESVLARFGASSFGFAVEPGRALVTFSMKNGRRVRFVLQVPEGTSEKIAQQQRARWRALLLTVKSKMVSVESRIETFEEAFLAHIVNDDGSTIYEKMKDSLLALPAPTTRQ